MGFPWQKTRTCTHNTTLPAGSQDWHYDICAITAGDPDGSTHDRSTAQDRYTTYPEFSSLEAPLPVAGFGLARRGLLRLALATSGSSEADNVDSNNVLYMAIARLNTSSFVTPTSFSL